MDAQKSLTNKNEKMSLHKVDEKVMMKHESGNETLNMIHLLGRIFYDCPGYDSAYSNIMKFISHAFNIENLVEVYKGVLLGKNGTLELKQKLKDQLNTSYIGRLLAIITTYQSIVSNYQAGAVKISSHFNNLQKMFADATIFTKTHLKLSMNIFDVDGANYIIIQLLRIRQIVSQCIKLCDAIEI